MGGPRKMPADDVAPSILGVRLREARRARGITQADAAEEIGVSRPTLIAVEQGRRQAQSMELVKLAKLYGRQVHDLVRSSPPVEALAASFRATTSSRPTTQAAVEELERLADDATEVEESAGVAMPRNYPHPYDIEGLPVEVAADQVAQAERRRLGLGDGPILQLRALLENEVGIKIFSLTLPARVAGLFAVAEPAGACIGMNSLHPAERQRWTLAHEYGHFLTDRWSAEVTELGSVRGKERFAEAFAGRFLMPASSVTRKFQTVRRSRDGRFTATDLLQLAAQYQVSAQAFALRLEDLRLVTSGWWQELIDRGLKVVEAREQLGIPGANVDNAILPERLQYLAVELYLAGNLSEGRLVRLLRVDRATARRIVRGLGRSSDVSSDGDLEHWSWGSDAAESSRG